MSCLRAGFAKITGKPVTDANPFTQVGAGASTRAKKKAPAKKAAAKKAAAAAAKKGPAKRSPQKAAAKKVAGRRPQLRRSPQRRLSQPRGASHGLVSNVGTATDFNR